MGIAAPPRKFPIPNLTDVEFNFLKVIKYFGAVKGQNSWLCQCLLCEKGERIVSFHDLRNGVFTTCGCSKIDPTIRIYYKEFGRQFLLDGFTLTQWAKILEGAKARNLEISIDFSFAYRKYLEQNKKCYYTGEPIFFNGILSKNETTASLDRINSNKGYTKTNVQWVHKDVNVMKNDYTHEEFVTICYQIANYRKLISAN